jgi:hypothetical protein
MLRRKRDAACFNTPSYKLNVTRSELCNCTLVDTGAWGVLAAWLVGTHRRAVGRPAPGDAL